MSDKKRKKRKQRAKQGDETARTEDKETEGKQEVESGDEEPAAAEALVMEDEGIIHHLVLLLPLSMTVMCLTAALYQFPFYNEQFLQCSTIDCYVKCCISYRRHVCLSCLSVMRWYCVKMTQARITESHLQTSFI